MASYKISFKKSAEKDFRKIDKKEIPRVLSAIEALSEEPFPQGCRKLVGSNHTYRVRIGDYRVVYFTSTEAKEIVIQLIRHRKDAYK